MAAKKKSASSKKASSESKAASSGEPRSTADLDSGDPAETIAERRAAEAEETQETEPEERVVPGASQLGEPAEELRAE